MPLVLSLKEGQDFFVGDEQFTVAKVHAENDFEVRRERDQKMFKVSDDKASEVLDDVMVSAGLPELMARVVIDADQETLVLRGDKYRNGPKGATVRRTHPGSRWAGK